MKSCIPLTLLHQAHDSSHLSVQLFLLSCISEIYSSIFIHLSNLLSCMLYGFFLDHCYLQICYIFFLFHYSSHLLISSSTRFEIDDWRIPFNTSPLQQWNISSHNARKSRCWFFYYYYFICSSLHIFDEIILMILSNYKQ